MSGERSGGASSAATGDGPGGARGWRARLWRGGPTGLLFALAAGLLALLFFAEFVFAPGRMIFGTDMVGQAYQLRQFAVEEIRSGRGIPLWNPFVFGGLPFVGVLPGPLFYPTSLLYLALPLARAISWTFVVHVAGAGVLAYGAARSFGLRGWAAALAGLSFMFAGYFLSTLYGGHDGRMFAMALIPGAFACVEWGLRTDRLLPFLLLGLVAGLQLLTPHVQMMYFSSLMVSLYFAWRWALRWGRDRPAAEGGASGTGPGARRRLLEGPWRVAGFYVAAFALAALLAAVQILPTLDLMGHAVRGASGQGGYEFASSWALPPQELSALFLPDLIGSLQGSYWGSNPFKLHTEYLGAVPLALALVGALNPRGDRRVWCLSGAAVLGLAFALGDATPVHRIAYELVPMIDKFRAPVMMLGPVTLFVSLLAGFGVERVLEAREGRREGEDPPGPGGTGSTVGWTRAWAVSAPFLALAAAALVDPDGLLRWVRNAWYPVDWPRRPPSGLADQLRLTGGVVLLFWSAALGTGQAVARGRAPRWALGALALLLVADLWRVDARYLETVRPERAFAAGPIVERMQEGLGPGERAWPLEGTFGQNELMLHRIPAVTGSQNFRLSWYDRLVGGVQQQELLRRPVLWQLLDVRYLTARSRLGVPMLEEVAREGRTGLYRLREDPPHAFFPARVRRADSTGQARRRTWAMGDPRGVAHVEAPSGAPEPRSGAGTASVAAYHPDRLVLDVEAREAGLLFVSEVYHPGWRAYVDGEEVPVLRTNGAFRGVHVPRGEHRVRMVYRSTPFRAGAALSGLALAALLAAVVVPRLRGRGEEA